MPEEAAEDAISYNMVLAVSFVWQPLACTKAGGHCSKIHRGFSKLELGRAAAATRCPAASTASPVQVAVHG
jgi:hypothetical protein